MNKFSKKYGSVYTVYFGHYPVVVLCGYDTVKEALLDRAEEFGGRGRIPTFDDFFKGYGASFSNGERWRDLRRFSLTILRNFGMGKKTIEERIQEEAQFLIEEIRSHKEQFFDPTKFLMKDMLPSVMHYVPGPHQRINKNLRKVTDFIETRIKMNEESFDPNSPRDYIDCFLIKQQQEQDNTNFNKRNMIMTILNIFFAGTETVSSTLRHGFMLLMKYPDIQAKVHEEIDRVIGDGRIPNIEDRSQMPYTDAVIHEIQRFADLLPMNVPHTTTRDVTFKGYTIPKGTDIYPLLCTVHQDPTKLSHPDKFDPNNFLDNKGCFKKNESYMPFSAGKRVCLGEGLAKMELFLFLTTILQRFRLRPEREFTDNDIKPFMTGFANVPKFYMSFIPRM
ncbi:LOW QUALITY PROTEIN: cytochrome P450 2G1-like [Leptodactylus fuscus]